MDARRDMGKAAARGKVMAVIATIEATVNEARKQCKIKNIELKNNIKIHYGIPSPRLKKNCYCS